MKVVIQSFGFKHGPPPEANMVIDLREMKNPAKVRGLYLLTGRDGQVQENVRGQKGYDKVLQLGQAVVNIARSEGAEHCVVAYGCTAGKHRSVVLAEDLAQLVGGEVEHLAQAKWPTGREVQCENCHQYRLPRGALRVAEVQCGLVGMNTSWRWRGWRGLEPPARELKLVWWWCWTIACCPRDIMGRPQGSPTA